MKKRVVVELVGGYCNSRCRWCFLQYEIGKQIVKGFMSRTSFMKFLDLNNPKKISLIPYSHGEALLHPSFNVFVEQAVNKSFVLCSIHTNLSMYLTDQHIRSLACVEEITVNVGGTDEFTHFTNMGTDLKVVKLNLQRLIERKEKGIKLKMVLNRVNIGQKDKLRDFAMRISESIEFSTYPIYFTTSDSTNEDKWNFFYRNLDGRTECRDSVILEGDTIQIKPKTKKCPGMVPTIRWNGKVQVCCRPRSQDGVVGDAFEFPITEIIQSDSYREAESNGRKRKYVSYCRYCS